MKNLGKIFLGLMIVGIGLVSAPAAAKAADATVSLTNSSGNINWTISGNSVSSVSVNSIEFTVDSKTTSVTATGDSSGTLSKADALNLAIQSTPTDSGSGIVKGITACAVAGSNKGTASASVNLDTFYQMTVTPSSSAAGSCSASPVYGYAGDACTLTASPQSSYRFVKWINKGTNADAASSVTFSSTSANNKYEAVFKEKITNISANFPASMQIGATQTVTPSITPSGAAGLMDINWSFSLPDGTGGCSWTRNDSGILSFTATQAGKVRMTATIPNGGNTGADATANFDIIIIGVPVTGITGIPQDITVGYDLALSGSNYPTVNPSNASNRTITSWNVSDAGGTGASINGSTFKASSAGTAKVTATIAHGRQDGSNYTTDPVSITVHKAPTISYDTGNRTLTVSLPNKVVAGYGKSSNITDVTGGYLEVFYNGSSVYNSGTTYQNSGKSFTVSASNVESIISSLSSKFSGTTASIEFRITPVGHTSTNTSGYERAEIYGTSGNVNLYLVAVGGANITSASYYGLAGSSLKITATPAAGYSFSQWSDGNTSNPRTVTVSTTTASNGYAATAVLGVNRSSSAGGGTGGGGGTGSYDPVPKTGEGNAVLWMMAVAILSGAVALTVLVRRIMKKEPETVQPTPTEKQDDSK